MTILIENTPDPKLVSDLAKMRKNRILGLKNHLSALVAKKIRLELEIKHVKEVLKRKGTKDSKNLRINLHLESSRVDQDTDLYSWMQQYPELIQDLRIADFAMEEILDLLKSEGLLSEEEEIELDLL